MYKVDVEALVQRVIFGEYTTNENYVTLDGDGNFISSNYVRDLIEINDLVNYYIDDDDFLIDNGIIEEEEEEEEIK